METALSKALSRKVGRVQETEREKLLKLAVGVEGLETRLGRGDPDLETPAHILRAGKEALEKGYTHYTHWAGMIELREAIGRKLRADNGLQYDPKEEIVVTAGVEEAMYAVFQALLDPGDEVIIGDPYYTCYDGVVEYAGGKLVYIPTYQSDNFVLQPEAIHKNITPKTKALVVVTPNNPTAAVIPHDILKEIARIAVERNLMVISDEIYEKLIFDDLKHTSIASFPGMYERTVVLNGFSKTYSMTGWRVGYFAAPADFVQRVGPLKVVIDICANQAAQMGALAALTGPEACLKEIVSIYDERRRFFMKVLDEAGLTYGYPGGSYYLFVNIQPTGRSAFEFCRDLLQDAKVQLFPGTCYGHIEGYVRISLTAPTEDLKAAAERMGRAVKRYIREKKGRSTVHS
jgi:aminotransferase